MITKVLPFALLLLLGLHSPLKAQPIYPNFTFYDSHRDEVYVPKIHTLQNIVATPDGGHVVAINGGQGFSLIMARVNPQGLITHTQAIGHDAVSHPLLGPRPSLPYVLRATPDGGFIVGGAINHQEGFATDILSFLAKVDSNFNAVWHTEVNVDVWLYRPGGFTYNWVRDIQVLPDSSLLVALYYHGGLPPYSPNIISETYFHVSPQGTVLSARTMDMCEALSVAVPASSTWMRWMGSQGSGCGMIPAPLCYRRGGILDSVVTGHTYHWGNVGGPGFLTRMQTCEPFAQGDSFLVAGIMRDSLSITVRPFLMKCDSNGTPAWTRRIDIPNLVDTTIVRAIPLDDGSIGMMVGTQFHHLSGTGQWISGFPFTYIRALGLVRTAGTTCSMLYSTPIFFGLLQYATLSTLNPSAELCLTNPLPSVATTPLQVVPGPTANYPAYPHVPANYPMVRFSGNHTFTRTVHCASVAVCNLNPTVSPQPTQVCQGDSLSFSAQTPFAISHTWLLNGQPASSGTDFAWHFLSPGTDTITYIASNLSCADTLSFTIEVLTPPSNANAGPDQLPSAALCGLSTQLAATPPSTGVGTWTLIAGVGGTIADSSQPNSAFSGQPGSTYLLAWTVSIPGNPCPNALGGTDTVAITFPALPDAQFSASTSAGSGAATLTDLSTGPATAWSWTFGDGNGSTQQHPTHTYATSGTYTVCLTVTSPDGCQDSICQPVTVTLVGLPLLPRLGWSTHPQPARADLHIQAPHACAQATTLFLTDLSGRVLRQVWVPAGQSGATLRLEGVAAGLYQLHGETEEGRLVLPVLILGE